MKSKFDKLKQLIGSKGGICIALSGGVDSSVLAHAALLSGVDLLCVTLATPYTLNRDLIRAAALLHDITKTRSFVTSENHALTGGQFLSDLGYPEVGDLVRQHVRLDEYET